MLLVIFVLRFLVEEEYKSVRRLRRQRRVYGDFD